MVLTDVDHIINHRLPNLFLYLGKATNMIDITKALKERKQVCDTHIVYISCPLFETDPNWHSPQALELFEAIQELEAEKVALYSLCEFPTFLLYSFFMRGKLKELIIYSDVTFIFKSTQKQADYLSTSKGVKKLKLHLDNAHGMTGWLALLTDPMVGKNVFKEICLLGSFQEVEDESLPTWNDNPTTACRTHDWTTWQAFLFWECLVQLQCERMKLQSFLNFHPNFLKDLVKNGRCLKRLTTLQVRVDCRLVDDSLSACIMKDLLESNYTLESIKVENLGHAGLNSFWNDLKGCNFYLELNRKGRRKFLQQDWQDITQKDWVDALIASKGDVSSLFYLLVRNPTLCHDAKPSGSYNKPPPKLGEILQERHLVSWKGSIANCLKQIPMGHRRVVEHVLTDDEEDDSSSRGSNAPIFREEEQARPAKGRRGWSRYKPTMQQVSRCISSLIR